MLLSKTGGEVMTILEQMNHFSDRFGKSVIVNNTTWRYYRVGAGAPILWLTGGLLAQAYLAHRTRAVKRLILSSTGPADYGKVWLPVEYGFIALVRLLPEKTVKNMLTGGLVKFIHLSEAERAQWLEAINAVMQNELSRADVISHFGVAADLIRKGIVTPTAYQHWTGRIILLSAENDQTQSKKDIPRYEKLFGRAVEVVNMGSMGHTALLFHPDKYVELLEQALV
jgi:pimeloyl-ACP methyl ester carboxylesterase